MEIPTNAEIIHNEGLEGKILVQIPKTKFAILGQKRENETWDVWIISRLGTARQIIGKSISQIKFNAIIQKTLAYGEVGHYKQKMTMSLLIQDYKLTVIKRKTKIKFDSTITL